MVSMRFLRIVAVVASATVVAMAPASATDLVVGTSSPGGSYFLMGGGLSTTITRDLPGINVSTRTTAGSTTNVRVLAQPDGGLQLGLANLGAVYDAVHAKGKFTD